MNVVLLADQHRASSQQALDVFAVAKAPNSKSITTATTAGGWPCLSGGIEPPVGLPPKFNKATSLRPQQLYQHYKNDAQANGKEHER